MSNSALFVGGPWDGRRAVLERAPTVFEVAELDPKVAAHPVEYIRHQYFLSTDRAAGAPVVYAHSSVSGGLLKALVEGYRAEVTPC